MNMSYDMKFIIEMKFELASTVYFKQDRDIIVKAQIRGVKEDICLSGDTVPKVIRETLYTIKTPDGAFKSVREATLFNSPQEAFK